MEKICKLHVQERYMRVLGKIAAAIAKLLFKISNMSSTCELDR